MSLGASAITAPRRAIADLCPGLFNKTLIIYVKYKAINGQACRGWKKEEARRKTGRKKKKKKKKKWTRLTADAFFSASGIYHP